MRSRLLSKYFPPPAFLSPDHIGLAFSDKNIKAVSMERRISKPFFRSEISELEPGAIVGGKIQNSDSIAKSLAGIKEIVGDKFVFFAIPDELAYIFSTEIPYVAHANLTDAIAFTIEENVPLSLSDTVFDYEPVQVMNYENEAKVKTVVAACMKKEVEKYIEIITKAGFEVVGALPESQAISNSIIPNDSKGSFCIVHARKDRVGIYLVQDGIVSFSTLRSIYNEDFSHQFLDEYEKFLEYNNKFSKSEEGKIKMIYVCGEFEFAEKVVEVISKSNYETKECKLANVWSNLLKINEVTPNINYEESLNISGPLGALNSQI